MMGPVWLLVALLPGRLGGLGHVVDLPGCPFEKQTAFCLGSATCHSLAHSGLTCEGMADIEECASFCAYPCCNSETTSTATSITHTRTSTRTTRSSTRTSTISITTSRTTTKTATATTITTATTIESPETGGSGATTSNGSLGPAAVLRISMMVEVSDPQEYLAYFDDEAVREAYINVMSEVASVPKELVDLKRTSSQLGFITVIYAITIPYTGDTPSIPLTSIQDKLSSIDIPSFNELLNAEMREVAGVNAFQQKVVSVTLADDDISVNGCVSALVATLPTVAALGMVAM